MAGQLADDGSIAAAECNLGRLEFSRRRYLDAVAFFERALEAARRADNVSLIAAIMCRLGAAFRACGRYEVAAKFLYQSLHLREANVDFAGQGECLAEIGVLLAERGDIVNALGHCERAVALYEEIQDLGGSRAARIRLVQLYLDQGGNRGDAVAHAVRAVELARQTLHLEDEARALDLLGQVRHRAGELDAAESAWRSALRVYVDRGDLQARAVQARLDELTRPISVPEGRSGSPRGVRRDA
jgi:tetratricopeptide (TPR) repeat protein